MISQPDVAGKYIFEHHFYEGLAFYFIWIIVFIIEQVDNQGNS